MKGNPVAWFEIPVVDMDRAKKFYEAVFGYSLKVMEMGPRTMAFFPMGEQTYGTTGALVKEETFVPSLQGTLIYFSVSDIDATLAKINASAGKILIGKTSIGEYGFVGYFQDSEGNRVALHTMK